MMTNRDVFALALAASFLLLAGLSAAIHAGQPQDGSGLSIDRLGWISGTWTRTKGDRSMEEHWTSPAGGTMLGVARTVTGDKTREFEFLRIVQESPDRIVYYASPGGRCPATPFTLTELGENRAVFDNPEHDFPKRISYWLDDTGAMHASIQGDLSEDARKIEWSWMKAD